MSIAAAVIPLRIPGKTRLAGSVTVEERAALSIAMLSDVVAALRDADVVEITVAARGEEAAAAAAALGATVIADPTSPGGLNAAIGAATQHLSTRTELLVVAADLPLLTRDDLSLLAEGEGQVVIAPTAGGGTGGLLRRPPRAIDPAFGPNSAQRHEAAAHKRGLTVSVIHELGFQRDVDTLDDLRSLPQERLGAATRAVLAAIPDARKRRDTPVPGDVAEVV